MLTLKTKAKAMLLFLGVFLLSPSSLALNSGIDVEGIDTVAGYSALLRISNAPTEEPLEIWIEKPDGSEVVLKTESDEYGKAKVDLEGFYTKRAGDYTVKARVAGDDEDFGNASSFTVYADTVSASRSTMSMDRTTASANGNDYVSIEVHLKDRYNNPIAGHTVNLISSRLNDEIIRISKNPYTDPQGTLLFHVYSRETGVSTFVANDSTSNVTLNDRAKIAYYEPDRSTAAIGGNTHVLLTASSSAGPVSHLEIEDLETEASVGQTLNFTVTAYDDDNNVATDYTGTVRFSSSDSNANLPDDYEFEAEDQGTHTFSLSLSFNTTGTQTLSVTDIDDTDVEGTIEVTVSSSGTGSSTSSGDDSDSDNSDEAFVVYTPTSGTYSSDSLSFTGKATYGLTVEINDNGTSIGSTTVKADGGFSYTATHLEDGEHSYTVSTTDEDGTVEETSDAIDVTIDTAGPEIDNLEIEPEGSIPAGDTFTVTIYTEKNLPEVSILFNNELFDLTEDVLIQGMYQGTMVAPEEIGEYEVDVILVDDVGNEASYNAAGTVEIIENTEDTDDSDTDSTTDEPTDEDALERETIPGPVQGLEAVEGDGRVTLSWEAPCEMVSAEEESETESLDDESTMEESEEEVDEADECASEEETVDETTTEETETDSDSTESENESASEEELETLIDHYRIYYGPDPELMYSYDDTLDSSTTWYVDDLDNGTPYYFKVVAVTTEDIEGEESEAISSTPESDEEEALYEAALEDEEETLGEEAEEDAMSETVEEEETPETGPEIVWLIVLSLGFGTLYFRKSNRPLASFSTENETTHFDPEKSVANVIHMMDIRGPRS